VALPHEITVPSKHRVRAHEQSQPAQELPRQRHQQSSNERAVLGSERRSVPAELSFKDGDLVAQNEDLRVLLTVAHRQQPHGGEDMGDSQIGKAKQHR
jgi:hypothetical protein